MNTRTYVAKPKEISRTWHLVDAEGQVLGRLSARVAHLLRGKHKPIFTPHVDCGDGVVVINAGKVRVTGDKLTQRTYRRYSGYPGGLKSETMQHLLDRRPTEVIRRAVVGMLPRTTLGRRAARRLKIYAEVAHPHDGQLKMKNA